MANPLWMRFRFARAGDNPVLAALILVALFPVLAKPLLGDLMANALTGLVLWALAFLLGLRFSRSWLHAPGSHVFGVCLICFGLFAVAWQWQVGHLWLNGQLLLYSGIAASFVAMRLWLSRMSTSSRPMHLLFEVKLGAVFGASLLILAAIFSAPEDPGALREVIMQGPIYGNIRHFNNDQFFAIAIGIYFASTAATFSSRKLWLAGLVPLGYLLAWSGGRGIILSLFVFMSVALIFRVIQWRILLQCCLALLCGAVLVFLSGHADDLLLGQVSRTAGGVNELSSNRMYVWVESLRVWSQSWVTILFGFGPDAILTTVRGQMSVPPPIFQVHNGLIQMLLEFGLLGFTGFIVLLCAILKRVVQILTSASAPQPVRFSAALLAALAFYMLFTGIIYHAIPFSFAMFLAAYVFSGEKDLVCEPQTES